MQLLLSYGANIDYVSNVCITNAGLPFFDLGGLGEGLIYVSAWMH